MGQNGFDRACVSAVCLFLLCFIAHSYEANGGTDMEVLACFRPGFLFGTRIFSGVCWAAYCSSLPVCLLAYRSVCLYACLSVFPLFLFVLLFFFVCLRLFSLSSPDFCLHLNSYSAERIPFPLSTRTLDNATTSTAWFKINLERTRSMRF